MYCHPPLEPHGEVRKKRGMPLEVSLRGVAVMQEVGAAAGSNGVVLLQRQQQELAERLAVADKHHQVGIACAHCAVT